METMDQLLLAAEALHVREGFAHARYATRRDVCLRAPRCLARVRVERGSILRVSVVLFPRIV